MRFLNLFFLFFTMFSVAHAQDPVYLELVPNKTVEYEGVIDSGVVMEDLSWAWNSSVACFPATVSSQFKGKHVLYVVDVPRYSELEIKLIPTDESADYSLYAYQAGKITARNLVPNLQRCIRCEADYSTEYRYVNRVQDHTRTVKDILAINNPYQAVIGVVGPPGADTGAFKLQISMRSR